MSTLEKWPVLGKGFFPEWRTGLSDLFDMDNFLQDRMFETPVFNKLLKRMPAANIKETDDFFTLELAAPGLEKKDFTVDIKDGILEIKVEKEQKEELEKDNFTRREYSYNSFCRSFTLPENINVDKVLANYQKGVLEVKLPKLPMEAKTPVKEIKVG